MKNQHNVHLLSARKQKLSRKILDQDGDWLHEDYIEAIFLYHQLTLHNTENLSNAELKNVINKAKYIIPFPKLNQTSVLKVRPRECTNKYMTEIES